MPSTRPKRRTYPRSFKRVAGGKRVSERTARCPEVAGFVKVRDIRNHLKELPHLPYNDQQDIDWDGTAMQRYVNERAVWSRANANNRRHYEGGADNLLDGGEIKRLQEQRT